LIPDEGFAGSQAVRCVLREVDPILWTKKGHSLATLLPAFLTGNSC
jgi:hypothetical protein